MTLDEAIKHLNETLSDKSHKWSCESCKQEHEQLLEWLRELKALKEKPQGDLISRSYLHTAIGKRVTERHGYFALRDIKDAIDNAPPVDTNEPTLNESIAFHNGYELGKSERPQGKWLDEEFVAFHLTCNQCGCNLRRQKNEVFKGDFDYNFCPNCGASMKGGAV